MRLIVIIALLLLFDLHGYSQKHLLPEPDSRKGDIYFYWGWNRGWYSKSDITFTGPSYNFELDQVIARDQPTDFSFDTYFNPVSFTIPQYNFRLGYFINDHYDVSFGIDHMKYVVQANQIVKINGTISETGTIYDGTYNGEEIPIAKDFIQFEHTDGLNYINIEFRRFDKLFDLNNVSINITEGLGAGFLLPKTNAVVLNNERHDDFHLAGYGVNAVVGLNVTIYKYIFLQTEFKGGFIHMPDIRTTSSSLDRASQSFFFSQFNFVLGVNIPTRKAK